jgi:Zn-finger protein
VLAIIIVFCKIYRFCGNKKQISVHMAQQFQSRRFFKNWPIRNKNCLWWPCLVMDQNKCALFREDLPWYSVTSLFYTLQVGIHILIFFLAKLAKGNMNFCHHLVSVVCHPFTFHILIFSEGRRFFKNRPIRNKNCLWWPCLVMDHNEMCTL